MHAASSKSEMLTIGNLRFGLQSNGTSIPLCVNENSIVCVTNLGWMTWVLNFDPFDSTGFDILYAENLRENHYQVPYNNSKY